MNIDKIKSIFPDFQTEHFNMFDTITSLKWETVLDCSTWEEHKNLLLTMTCPESYQIIMKFTDVRTLHFQGNGQVSGFYIKDMSANGYENNAKYKIGDFEEDALGFYCSDITIRSLEKVTQ